MNFAGISEADVEQLYKVLNNDAEAGGYHLNPDIEFTKNLARGLLRNQQRYGYQACPCRLASGKRTEDLDIICPCDYRDPDVLEFGACYCALYVSAAILAGQAKLQPVSERRPPRLERDMKKPAKTISSVSPLSALAYPVWRCKVCGYLCARDQPPEVCPVCKAKQDRFERFI
jgi:ferredoxin-thioredoxin reductase catalytic subunit